MDAGAIPGNAKVAVSPALPIAGVDFGPALRGDFSGGLWMMDGPGVPIMVSVAPFLFGGKIMPCPPS